LNAKFHVSFSVILSTAKNPQEQDQDFDPVMKSQAYLDNLADPSLRSG